ncbi:transposase [Streptomyces goshikiensis]|uniref:transposase n=1 Tax=Streptomyces goshikiensis TaxID=1942 RepID=UPI00371596CA
MTPPRARTWGRRGHTPVIRVRGRSRRRTSVAALCCYKTGEKSRLIHRPRNHLLLKGARKSFSWQDYRDLLVRAHIQLGGPIVVIWDNLNTHLAAGLKRYEAEHDWLTTIRLPAYAPDLAGEINRNPADLPAALANYERVLRPFVNEIQGKVNPRILRVGMPLNKHAISAFQNATALACFLHIPDLVARLSKEDRGGDWQLPAYAYAHAA